MTEYKEKIDALRAVDREGSSEYVIQVALVGTGITLVWLFEGLWQLLPWFLVVYGLSTLERVLYRREPQPYSYRLYIGYLVLGYSIATASACLPVLLWTKGEPIYHFGALVYLVGATLNTFVVRSRAWPSLLCYAIPNGLAMMSIAALFVLENGLTVATVIPIVLAIWITLYLVVMIRESVERVQREQATTKELLTAQKAETLANFAGGVAHDFNNLLGVISASLEQAKQTAEIDKRDELVDQTLAAVGRSAGLTKQLLAVGRQSDLTTETIDVQAFVVELEQFLKRIIPSSIKISVTCDPTLRSLDTEPNLLQSMLLNLAMNGRDAMSDGGSLQIIVDVVRLTKRVSLSTGELRPGVYASFTVRDDGQGIPSEVFGRVLDPFFSTRPVGQGTGLGLAMVAGFSKQVGGAMDISSQQGLGTTVCFYVPLTEGWEYPPVGTGEAVKRIDDVATRTCKVLLVEDEPALNQMLDRYLSDKGYEVHVCDNADAGLAAVEAGYVPDILLTDIVMSGSMQGPDLVTALKRRFPDLLCIVMSGYAFNHTAPSVVDDQERASFRLNKPFSLKDLDRLITQAAV
ncbi:MAG: ATP-binding protein [Pseudomonadota bacterium]